MSRRNLTARELLYKLAIAADALAYATDDARDARAEIDWFRCENAETERGLCISNEAASRAAGMGSAPLCSSCAWNSEMHKTWKSARAKRSGLIRSIAALGRELREYTPFADTEETA